MHNIIITNADPKLNNKFGYLDIEQKEKQKLYSWAKDLGISLSAYKVHILGLYLDELWEWNGRTNLTGISSREKIIKELFLDSLLSSYCLPDEGRLLDVGSGAGLPGIPIKVGRPMLEIHLMEANAKKVSFLRHVIRLMQLTKIKVIRGRIEMDKGGLHPEGYHVVTARALGPLSKIIPWLAPHLMPNGLLVNFQGKRFSTALEESGKIIREMGLRFYKSIPYSLPESSLKRHIIIFTKQPDW